MLQNRRGPLTDEVSKLPDQALKISSDNAALGKRWTRICVELGGVSQAWMAHVDQNHEVHWIANWPAAPILHRFPSHIVERAIQGSEPVMFEDHDELISGGVFPISEK